MRRLTLPLYLLLLLACPASAHAAAAGGEVTAVAVPAAPDRARIEALLDQAVAAARSEAERADSVAGIDPDDRRDLQTQFARILRHAQGCDAAADYINQHPAIMGTGVELVITDGIRRGDRRCVAALAALMLKRAADPIYTPSGQIGLEFRAGAFIASSGNPEGLEVMRRAEGRLLGADKAMSLWETRFKALDAYEGTPGQMGYFEYLADRMVAEHQVVPASTRRGILSLFALRGRCDLVARVVLAGSKSCDEAMQDAKMMYIDPPPSLVEGAQAMVAMFGLDEPVLAADSINAALAEPKPWARLTRLLVFVRACRTALDAES